MASATDFSFPSGNKGKGKKAANENQFDVLGSYSQAYKKHQAKLHEDEPMPDQETMTVQVEDDLPAFLRNKEAHCGMLYPKYLGVDVSKKFDLTCVHGGDNMYRRQDVPAFKSGKKSILGSGDQYSVHGVAMPPPGGPSNIPSVSYFGYCGNRYDKETIKVDPRDVHLSLRAYTQRPYVQASIVLERNEKGQATKQAQWHCYANALKRSPDDVGIHVMANRVADYMKAPDVLESVKNKNLFSVVLQLLSANSAPSKKGANGRPFFTGISSKDLQDWTSEMTNGRGSNLSPAQRYIVALNQASSVHFFGDILQRDHAALEEAGKFMRTVCYATAHYGTFWYWTLAVPTKSIHDHDFPFSEIDPPRWLVTAWKVTRRNGEAISAEPSKWKKFPVNSSMKYPDAVTYGFENKLGHARELRKNDMRLKDLSRLDKYTITGTFVKKDDQSIFMVSCRITGSKGDPPVPEYDRKLEFRVNCGYKEVKFMGSVIGDVMGFNEHFTISAVMVDVKGGDKKPPKFDQYYKAPLAVHFSDDSTAIDRMINSLTTVQRGQLRKEGIHYGNIAFGAPVPSDHEFGWMKKQMASPHPTIAGKTRGQVYCDEIDLVTKGNFNETQAKCAAAPVEACPIDELLLHGPPGTGKTTGMSATVRGLLAAGHRVIVAASSNVAVNRAMEAFEAAGFGHDGALKDWDELNFVRFAGTIARTTFKQELPTFDIDGDANMDDGDGFQPLPSGALWSEEAEDEDTTRLNATFEMVALSHGNAAKSDLVKSWSGFSARLHEYIKRFAYIDEPQRDQHPEGTDGDAKFEAAENLYKMANRYLELHEQINLGDRSKSSRREFRSLNSELGDIYLDKKVRLVFTTASSAAHPALVSAFKPDVGLLDEAAQSSPGDCITLFAAFQESMAFFMQCGDHNQLKPVVTSGEANETAHTLQVSLFEKRVQAAIAGYIDTSYYMYNIQYRFHSDINDFVTTIYDDKLVTGDGVDAETELDKKVLAVLRPLGMQQCTLWNGRRRICLDASNASVIEKYRCSVRDGQPVVMSERWENGTSSSNATETAIAMDVVAMLKIAEVWMEEVSILSPYQGHRHEIIQAIHNVGFLSREEKNILSENVLPIDSAQGMENKVGIICMTINDPDKPDNLGFTHDEGRVTVAASRAQRFLFYIGNFMGWVRSIHSDGSFIKTSDAKVFRRLVEQAFEKKDIIPYSGFRLALINRELVPSNTFYRDAETPLQPKAFSGHNQSSKPKNTRLNDKHLEQRSEDTNAAFAIKPKIKQKQRKKNAGGANAGAGN